MFQACYSVKFLVTPINLHKITMFYLVVDKNTVTPKSFGWLLQKVQGKTTIGKITATFTLFYLSCLF